MCTLHALCTFITSHTWHNTWKWLGGFWNIFCWQWEFCNFKMGIPGSPLCNIMHQVGKLDYLWVMKWRWMNIKAQHKETVKLYVNENHMSKNEVVRLRIGYAQCLMMLPYQSNRLFCYLQLLCLVFSQFSPRVGRIVNRFSALMLFIVYIWPLKFILSSLWCVTTLYTVFLSSIFKTAVAQKLYSGFCWNLQRLHRKDDN